MAGPAIFYTASGLQGTGLHCTTERVPKGTIFIVNNMPSMQTSKLCMYQIVLFLCVSLLSSVHLPVLQLGQGQKHGSKTFSTSCKTASSCLVHILNTMPPSYSTPDL